MCCRFPVAELELESQHGPRKAFVKKFLQVTRSMVVAYIGLLCRGWSI